MNWRANLPLIAGLALPVLLIVVVVISIYLPRAWVKPPQYDLLYSIGPYPTYIEYQDKEQLSHEFVVRDGHLADEAVPITITKDVRPYPGERAPRFFVYDVHADSSRSVTLAEAKALALDTSKNSPDGWHLERAGDSGGFPFFFSDGNSNDQYLVGHNSSRRLDVQVDNISMPGQYNQLNFIGWIKQ